MAWSTHCTQAEIVKNKHKKGTVESPYNYINDLRHITIQGTACLVVLAHREVYKTTSEHNIMVLNLGTRLAIEGSDKINSSVPH